MGAATNTAQWEPRYCCCCCHCPCPCPCYCCCSSMAAHHWGPTLHERRNPLCRYQRQVSKADELLMVEGLGPWHPPALLLFPAQLVICARRHCLHPSKPSDTKCFGYNCHLLTNLLEVLPLFPRASGELHARLHALLLRGCCPRGADPSHQSPVHTLQELYSLLVVKLLCCS